MSWNNLPPELRNQILNYIVEDYFASVEEEDCPILTPYTTVSREWQLVFETITFQNISLVIYKVGDFDDFARSTSGHNTYRRHHIRNISIIIVLPGYQCRDCEWPESAEEIEQNNHVFTQSMMALLDVLSTWTPNRHPDGLTLELNIKSSSDTEHHFNNHTMFDRYPLKHWNWNHRYHNKLRYRRIDKRSCNEVSMWTNDDLVRQGCRALERYLGSVLEFTDVRLPRAEVVTSLLQRLQFKRQLSPFALRKLMQESFVQLSSLRLERWCRPTTSGEQRYIKDFKNHFLPYLPESLHVFQYYAERPTGLNLTNRGRVKPLCTLDLLSIQGHCFKEVSVVEPQGSAVSLEWLEYMAATSLSQPLITTSWHMLERVCFDTKLFYPYEKNNIPPHINSLLKISASVAEMMPNLLSWEIYEIPFPYEGRLFCFSVQSSSAASMLWKYRWPRIFGDLAQGFAFSPEVKSAWDKVAILRTGNSINCLVDENNSKMDDKASTSYENMMHGSLLDDHIFEVDPVHPFTEQLGRWWKEDQLLDLMLDRWL
ncbi:hypothetical protein FPOAC2_07166 [Fusarium poae]|uniref:hypothetical protein n=1 Tax=Fusarium poae TaxID=36050 RepID=UPI001CEA6F97|nr:hypothetical protein FPOAC1_007021 [Fusarium poae]KAG8673705.1 hypothetical protein FPOAC1_007021 [Fusarium poae]